MHRAATPQPFRIAIPDDQLQDLRGRLGRTRYPAPTPVVSPWDAGVDIAYLATMLDRWRTGFDWRAAERSLNGFPQFTTTLNGERIHFVRLTAKRTGGSAAPIPIVLTHGWPYSFVEMLPLAERLADPAGYGAPAEDAFDVVVPSLPGYGFSDPMGDPFTSPNVARRWHALMTEVLGYPSYATYGEDVGTWVSDRLAASYPQAVIGLFATHAAFPPEERRNDLTPGEQAFIEWLDRKWEQGRGYSAQQSTRPDTLAVGLTDSPAGLAAWMLEKFREWSGAGEVSDHWSTDELLTTISLYWFTGTIGTSFRAYYDDRQETPMPRIHIPVGVSVQWGERGFPRSNAERPYTHIR